MDINGDRLWSDIQELGRIGCNPDGSITRLSFTPQDRQAQDWLEARMADAGLLVREDAAGNLIGELSGSCPEKSCIICGSHYDTVPGGGRFDGTLGILSALEAVRRIREQGITTKRTIRLAAFKDEEGSRFGYGMVGSKAVCGMVDPAGLSSRDKDGITLEQAMTDYGCRPGELSSCRMEDAGAYLELHIEQGKVLENHGASIGIVSGIAGLVRYTVEIRGESGHAGATPMKARKDPVPAMCQWIGRVTELAEQRDSCVATVGSIAAWPGARNVICGRVVFSLDLRSIHEEDLRDIMDEMERYGAELSGLRGIRISLHQDLEIPPCRCHEPYREAIRHICRTEGYSFIELMSGAGHDCMNFKNTCPTAMIFVPSRGGLSHRKEESTSREDCACGAKVLLGLLLETAGIDDTID